MRTLRRGVDGALVQQAKKSDASARASCFERAVEHSSGAKKGAATNGNEAGGDRGAPAAADASRQIVEAVDNIGLLRGGGFRVCSGVDVRWSVLV